MAVLASAEYFYVAIPFFHWLQIVPKVIALPPPHQNLSGKPIDSLLCTNVLSTPLKLCIFGTNMIMNQIGNSLFFKMFLKCINLLN